MRKLNTRDFFKVSKIYDKMDIKIEVNSKDAEKVGADLINNFIKNIWKAENEVIGFVADISEKKVEEIEALGPVELINIIKEVLKQEGALDFFTQVLK